MSGGRVAVFAPGPVLVCTFEHPSDRSKPDVALNVGGQGPLVARAVTALGAEAILVTPTDHEFASEEDWRGPPPAIQRSG